MISLVILLSEAACVAWAEQAAPRELQYGYSPKYPEYGYPHWGDHMCRYEKDHYGKWSCTISYKADCEWLMKAVEGMEPKFAEYYYSLCQCSLADTKYQCHDEYLKKNHYCQWLDDDRVYGAGHGLCVTSQYSPGSKIQIYDAKKLADDYYKVGQWRNERKYYCESLEYSDDCLCPSLTNTGSGWDNACIQYQPRPYSSSGGSQYGSGSYDYTDEKMCEWQYDSYGGTCKASWQSKCEYAMGSGSMGYFPEMPKSVESYYGDQCSCLTYGDEYSCSLQGGCQWHGGDSYSKGYCETQLQLPSDVEIIFEGQGYSSSLGSGHAPTVWYDQRSKQCSSYKTECECTGPFLAKKDEGWYFDSSYKC